MLSRASVTLLGTCVLAGISGALFTGLVARVVGGSIPLAATVGGSLMAIIVALVIARERRRAERISSPFTDVLGPVRCKAFLFDLDGVLVDSRAVVERTWRRWAQRHHVDPDALLRIAHGRRTMDTLQVAVPHLARDEEVAWLDTTELQDVEGLSVVPGANQLLSSLPPDRWAIVTSCTRALARLRLLSVGLPVPSVLVVSEEVSHGKPAPDGYRLAAERLGYDPAACLVFEDAPAGVIAGRTAGARVVALTTTHSAGDLSGAEAMIPDFSRLHVRVEHDDFIVSVH